MANSETPALISGEKTVTATGTAEALVSASQRAKAVTIIAKTGNTGQVYTGQVYIGGSDVATTTNDGLDAGETLSIEAVGWLDLADVFLDVDTNGEGVDFYAVKT